MKKILLCVGLLTVMQFSYAQTDPHFVLRGGSTNIDAVLVIAEAQNNLPFDVISKDDNTMGNNYSFSLVGAKDYSYNCSSNLSITTAMAGGIRTEDANPRTGVSINDVCPKQAKAISEVIQCANRLYREMLKDIIPILEQKEDCNCPEKKSKFTPDVTKDDGIVILNNTGVTQGIGLRVSPQERYFSESKRDLDQTYAKKGRERNPMNIGRAWFGAIHVRENQGWLVDVGTILALAAIGDLIQGDGFDLYGAFADGNNPFSNETWGPNDSGNESRAFIFRGISIQPKTGYHQQSKTFVFGFGIGL
ncbi:MAG: hypothetical protein ACI870_000543 [Crocinitomicaceae bacterium]|jgi:hypothetical protein